MTRARVTRFPAGRHLSPWRLGGLSVRDLGRRLYRRIGEDEIPVRAAALSYWFLFSLFPAFLVLTAVVGLFPGSHLIGRLLRYLDQVLPPDAASLLRETVREVVRGAHGGLLSVGAVIALWSASSGMASVMAALNIVYDIEDPRPWWQRRLLAVILTAGFALFTVTALLLMVFGPQIGERVAARIGLGSLFTAVWSVVSWPVLMALVLTGVALVYHFAPAAGQRWRWITPGSVVALAVWLGASLALRLYVSQVADYNATYGSIGGVILLLLWFYVTALVLLLGAEVNAEIEGAAADRGHPEANASGKLRSVKVSRSGGRVDRRTAT
ncbi:MAG TPA: YihY/virulence factor BrkB family protein [Methylomirabilota bacterium]|nr:YihY/virulence factor BrkB family protein [Methylomirabilota bacterium]